MSFRTEDKIPLTKYEGYVFLETLKKRGSSDLYPPRLIRSVYFENSFGDLFSSSEEGLLPRKKIRLRNYPESNQSKHLLEIKISSYEGRFKVSEEISKNKINLFLKSGFFDNYYGLCNPKVIVEYRRSYFVMDGIRITFDQDIRYSLFDSLKCFAKDASVVAEIKAKHGLDQGYLESLVPGRRSRFSKYSNAVKALNLY